MQSPKNELRQRLTEAAQRAFGADALSTDPAVERSNFADYQSSAALALAKRLKAPPRTIAERLRDALNVSDLCEAVELSGPGFLNFRLQNAYLADKLKEQARAGGFLLHTPDTISTIVVDYSHPNVAKEMHVGHLRSTIIGDCLCRVFEATGQRVIRQNHIGDWGTPFGMLIEHLLDVGVDNASRELSTGALSQFYQGARAKFESDPAFADRARARVVALQAGDPSTRQLWSELVAASTAYFQQVYELLNVKLQPEDVRGESAYNDELPAVASELEEKGIARRDQGALCVFLEGHLGKDGSPVPLIVQKSDGGYGYAATDLAAVKYRVETLGATRLVYVVGAPQSQHLQMVFKTAKLAGWLTPELRAEHVAFGSVLDENKKMFKSRAGVSVKLIDLLEEATQRALTAVREKNPNLDDGLARDVARGVGIGAIKYADLSSDRVKDYVFNFDRMLAFEGNTGPYLQYAHARICSIFRKAEALGVASESGDSQLVDNAKLTLADAAERRLALELVAFPDAVDAVLTSLSPHKLCGRLYDIATAFSEFYTVCPVLKAEAEQRTDRLLLCQLTRDTLKLGLELLGMTAPDRM